MTEDWYAPGEIRFNRRTALWLVQNLGMLRCGRWPSEVTNYVDVYARRSSNKANFTTPIEYAAEIEARLEECGQDGLALEAMECWGKSEGAMSKYLQMPVWSVRKRANRALAYVASGLNRRWHDTKKRQGQTYKDFKKKGANHGEK